MNSMASSCCCFAAVWLIALAGCVSAQTDVPTTTAMFVFGDSYADTGNSDYKSAASWQPPYGETWPGVPAGRFSDGKILTDNIASIIGIETPAPHQNRSTGLGCNDFSSGVNFAHGGTGIFTTYFAPEGPTLSNQIDEFEMMANDCSNIKSLIDSSMVLVVMVGNDYITYLVEHHDDWLGLLNFIPSVVNGTTDSITRLYNIGFRKFAVANLEPAGCIPYFAAANNQCNVLVNVASGLHNWRLADGVAKISSDLAGIRIIILNQFDSFRNAQENHFGNNLEACINSTTNIPCSDPDNFFFWDGVHPTQAGWKAVTDTYNEEVLNLVGSNNGQPVGLE